MLPLVHLDYEDIRFAATHYISMDKLVIGFGQLAYKFFEISTFFLQNHIVLRLFVF